MKTRFVVAILSAGLVSSSCAGQWPIRLPPRETWVTAPSPSEPLDISFEAIAQTAAKTQQRDIAAAWALITPAIAAEWFHAKAVQRGIQPLALILYNGSPDPYWFDPASASPRPISPERAAQRLSSIHPVVTAGRYVTWLALLPLSLVFVSVVEPSTGLEFTTMEEIVRRPTRSNRLDLQAQLMRYELPAGSLGPGETRAGLLLIHPPVLGDPLSVTLVNGRTHEPLVLSWNAQPAPSSSFYDTTYETVWNAAVQAAAAIPSWSVVSTDKTQGRILVRRRLSMKFLGGSRPPPITITVVPVSPEQTQTTLTDSPSRRQAFWFLASTQNSHAFFDGLTARLPSKTPPSAQAPPPPQPQPLPGRLRGDSSAQTY